MSNGELIDLAHTIRFALEPGIKRDDQGDIDTTGCCLHASLLL